MKRDITFERFYAHPPERVWKALTDSRYLAMWVMDNDFQPIVGHQFSFRTDPAPTFDGILNCEVLHVDEPKELVYSFIGGIIHSKTIVRWTLHSKPEGTLLRLEHNDFSGLTDMIVSAIIGYGWWKMFKDLPAVLSMLAESETA